MLYMYKHNSTPPIELQPAEFDGPSDPSLALQQAEREFGPGGTLFQKVEIPTPAPTNYHEDAGTTFNSGRQ